MVFIDDSYLGLGPTAFNNMFSNLGAQREGWYNVTWKGQNKKLPIYMISVKHLRYNLFNTRLKPHLEQYISENDKTKEYFDNISKCNDKTIKNMDIAMKLTNANGAVYGVDKELISGNFTGSTKYDMLPILTTILGVLDKQQQSIETINKRLDSASI